jgi:hypothetical protein
MMSLISLAAAALGHHRASLMVPFGIGKRHRARVPGAGSDGFRSRGRRAGRRLRPFEESFEGFARLFRTRIRNRLWSFEIPLKVIQPLTAELIPQPWTCKTRKAILTIC